MAKILLILNYILYYEEYDFNTTVPFVTVAHGFLFSLIVALKSHITKVWNENKIFHEIFEVHSEQHIFFISIGATYNDLCSIQVDTYPRHRNPGAKLFLE